MNEKSYFTTKSYVFCMAIQFVTEKEYYKFTNENKETIYSFEILSEEKKSFYNKLKMLENIKFS